MLKDIYFKVEPRECGFTCFWGRLYQNLSDMYMHKDIHYLYNMVLDSYKKNAYMLWLFSVRFYEFAKDGYKKENPFIDKYVIITKNSILWKEKNSLTL